ncbi:MAG TPA: phosphotransferase [Polyangiaceae bacterium]
MTGATGATLGERVQTLWGGYGEIRRVTLTGTHPATVIVKYVVPPAKPEPSDTPEGRSHRRKLRSYEVERAFYERYARRCGANCRVPASLHVGTDSGRMLFIQEDLDAAGFDGRRNHASDAELRLCLDWLAAFHATFLRVAPQSLWKVGTYWHLATRPDELRALGPGNLQRAAPWLDEELNRARFQTFVHGDAKLQNFCFASSADAVAAVDFQYVGGGVGVKDVAYFLTSCLSSSRLEREAESYLDYYFGALRRTLVEREEGVSAGEIDALEAEWRELYPVACADFYRFLVGWARESSRDPYLEAMTRRVLERR